MSDKEQVEAHESYGLVGFSRVTSNPPANFFGSSVRSGHYLVLSIKRAVRRRSLHQYWYGGREELIRLRLSPNQFAELLTTLNVGDGVPCTLERIGGKGMDESPSVDQRQQYEQEFKGDVQKVMADARTLTAEVREIFDAKPTINKTDRAAIVEKLRMLMQHIESNMPFVQTQFNEAMDKTVAEAKGEVEAFVNHKIHSLGIQALNSEVIAALEAPAKSEAFLLGNGEDGEAST